MYQGGSPKPLEERQPSKEHVGTSHHRSMAVWGQATTPLVALGLTAGEKYRASGRWLSPSLGSTPLQAARAPAQGPVRGLNV